MANGNSHGSFIPRRCSRFLRAAGAIPVRSSNGFIVPRRSTESSPQSNLSRAILNVKRIAALFIVLSLSINLLTAAQTNSKLEIAVKQGEYALTAENWGMFHSSPNEIRNARIISVPNSPARIAVWDEIKPGGQPIPFFAISLDGKHMARVQQTAYDVLLRYAQFDPLTAQPAVADWAKAKDPSSAEVYIVQFVTSPLEDYRKQLERLGAKIYKFIANHGYIVRMDARTREQVAAQSFVRWVGPYEPAYRMEQALLDGLAQGGLGTQRYNIQVFERGSPQQERVGKRITALGGKVEETNPLGFLLEATLDEQALLEVAQMNEVQFIDRWSEPETDVTTAREIGGANYVESVAGFTGEGVRGEVMDAGFRRTHQDFQRNPLIVHGSTPSVDSHGTSTAGIVFGTGTADIRGRGFLPDGQGIVARQLQGSGRYEHTAELISSPYFAVFQTNSWGVGLTRDYTTVSAQMDDILFNNDIVITQSQSNSRTQQSRPQAWAKNIVSVGGVRHYGSLSMEDHCWCSSASIGPAADGRIKPDLAHFYDENFTASGGSDTSYSTEFGGTSAATPIVAGHFGLFFQMWHNGIFGNPSGDTVFDSRPNMTTSKAILINTARQWNFAGLDHDLTRTHQGWGMPDLRNLYDLRDNIFIIDQTDVLRQLQTRTYQLVVPAGGNPLKATLAYKDPSGTTSSSQHRINDLSLKVTSPSNVVYWGNNGLLIGMWSAPGGTEDRINTVENVFIQNPEPGTWRIEVIATEINEDEYVETPELDSNYALVVSGVRRGTE